MSIPTLAQQQAEAPARDSGQNAPAAQKESSQPPESAKPTEKEGPKKEKKKTRGAIVVAPLPISSPAFGSGIIPVLGYIFPFSTKDKISPPSVIGAAGLITNNGTRGFALGGQLYFNENDTG